MNNNRKNKSALPYYLNKRKQMLQFHLLKYLNYDGLVKLKLVCKDGGNFCDAYYSK